MNPGRRRSNLLVDVVQQRQMDGGPPVTRLRTGPAAAAAVIAVLAAIGAGVYPAIAQQLSPQHTAAPVRQVADVKPASSPSANSPTAAASAAGRPAPPRRAMAPAASAARTAAAAPPVTFGAGLVVGPGAACCFTPAGQWNAGAAGGAPAFTGPQSWTTSAAATFQWSLGAPAGGRRWDQVRVRVWIPNDHARASVRYTVTSTAGGGAQSVRTFDLSQNSANGWYALPATFAIGTQTQRTGTIAVGLAYLRPYVDPATAQCAGCGEMAAAQVQFQWS
jgi:hypothetical protein